MLIKSGARGHFCLRADLEEESVDSFTITVMLAAGLEDTLSDRVVFPFSL